jgi:transmembrane sensor
MNRKYMPKNYKYFTVEDFVTDDDFISWVKYPTEESIIFWDSFINNEPDKKREIDDAKLLVEQLVITSKQNIESEDNK